MLLLPVAVLLLLSSCSANLQSLFREGRPVCSKDFDFDETIKEFRLPSGELQLIEQHLGRKLVMIENGHANHIWYRKPTSPRQNDNLSGRWDIEADVDTVSRFEIYHRYPDWSAMFVKIVEERSGRVHFFRLNIVPGGEKVAYRLEKIDEGVYNKWSNHCEL